MPLAFCASFDEAAEVAAIWKEVWTEESSSEAVALRLYTDEILAILLKSMPVQPGMVSSSVWHINPEPVHIECMFETSSHRSGVQILIHFTHVGCNMPTAHVKCINGIESS